MNLKKLTNDSNEISVHTFNSFFQSEFFEKNQIKKLQKPFYTLMECAIRSAELFKEEKTIKNLLFNKSCYDFETILREKIKQNPKFKCSYSQAAELQYYYFTILCDIRIFKIRCSARGMPKLREDIEKIPDYLLKISHNDLKKWFLEKHPNYTPSFLFDPKELQSECYKKFTETIDENIKLKEEVEELRLLKKNNEKALQNQAILRPKKEQALLNIIAVQQDLLEGRRPFFKPSESFKNRTALIELMADKYKGCPGLSKSNLEKVFSQTKNIVDSF